MMNDPKLIRCIIPLGKGMELLKLLKDEKDIITANKIDVRGGNVFARAVGEIQLETVDIIISQDRADEIFEYIYEKMEIGSNHHGVLYQFSLSRSSSYNLQESI